MRSRVEEDAVDVAEVGNTTTHNHRSRHCCLCVVTVACVIVTSLELLSICALTVNGIQRDVNIAQLQRQVADLQQSVAILHQQRKQQHGSVAQLLDTSRQHDDMHYTQVCTQLLYYHVTLSLKIITLMSCHMILVMLQMLFVDCFVVSCLVNICDITFDIFIGGNIY